MKLTIFVFMERGKHLWSTQLPVADCGSDHELFMISVRLNIRKTKSAEHPIRYDMMHIPEQFKVDIKYCLLNLYRLLMR